MNVLFESIAGSHMWFIPMSRSIQKTEITVIDEYGCWLNVDQKDIPTPWEEERRPEAYTSL
jgi:hypothetical protein